HHRRQVHAAGRAGALQHRAEPHLLRAAAGRRRGGRAAGADRLPGAAAAVPARHRDDRTQMRGFFMTRRLLVALMSSVLVLGSRVGAGVDPLRTYARDTWRSLTAMADPATGLVAD